MNANGAFTIGGVQTQVITSTTQVSLQGTVQTLQTGNGTPTAADHGGGNAGNLTLAVQVADQTLASSNGFSVAAIPVLGETDTLVNSGGYDAAGRLVNDKEGVNFGIHVKLAWTSDSGTLHDLSESFISEQVQIQPGYPTASFVNSTPDTSSYFNASLRGLVDQHIVEAGVKTPANTRSIRRAP